MSRHGAWISRRGQAGADEAIAEVLERQPGDAVQQLANALLDDNPYQARQPFSTSSVEDLAQGMRVSGFQGVLIARRHSDPTQQLEGRCQLVYGHRRRAAWQRVCTERGEACLLPVVVREISDEQMLIIGAQENLQRQDLDPLEEAQIVAWHEQIFFDKNQTELGAMLGKSSDWVSVRSRIHRLPDELKERLRQRPRAIAQMLELGLVYTQQPEAALTLADRVVHESLTLDDVRKFVRGYTRPDARHTSRSSSTTRRGAATNVQKITKLPATERNTNDNSQSWATDFQETSGRGDFPEPTQGHSDLSAVTVEEYILPARSPMCTVTDDALLQQATETLTILASRAEQLPITELTGRLLDQLEIALSILRRAFDCFSRENSKE